MKSGEAASNGPTGGHEAAAAADGSRPGSRSSQLDHLPPHQRPQLSGEVNMSVVFWRKVILVLKMILKYGRLKFFFFGQEKKQRGRFVGGHT